MSIEVREDNTAEVAGNIKNAITQALESVGLAAEGYAKLNCPVDTGNLRNSITHEVSGNDVYIGTNVEYAPYVELGTKRMKARGFLKSAASDHTGEYSQIFKSAFGG